MPDEGSAERHRRTAQALQAQGLRALQEMDPKSAKDAAALVRAGVDMERKLRTEVAPDEPITDAEVDSALVSADLPDGLTTLQGKLMEAWLSMSDETTEDGKRRKATIGQAANRAGIPQRVVRGWLLDERFRVNLREVMGRIVDGLVPLVHMRMTEEALDGNVQAGKLVLQLHDPEAFINAREAAELEDLYRRGTRDQVRVIDGKVEEASE